MFMMSDRNVTKYCKRFLALCIVTGLLFTTTGCSVFGPKQKPYKTYKPSVSETPVASEQPGVNLSEEQAGEFARRYLAKMTTEQKVAQLFVVKLEELDGSQGGYYEFRKCTKGMKTTLSQIPVGGVVLFSRNISTRKKTSKLIQRLQVNSQTPLFVTVDEEGGSVARIASNKKMKTTKFPTAESIGKTKDGEYVYNMGRTIAREIRALGFNVNFAPVADVKTSDLNTEIGERSFGSDPGKVSDMVAAFVQGSQERGVCATLKHFPGQGSSDGDTHQGSVDIDSSISKLRDLDFVPFKAGIDAGAEFVMVSHISVSRVTETKEPASMSELIMKTILREELGFSGIVITDAFDMASITDNYTPGEAALQSFMAGADIILMPNDLTQAYQAILNAVNSKKITQSRLDESVIRILTTKFKHGILTQEDLTVWEQPTATPSVTPAVTVSPKAKKGKKNRKSAKTIKKSTKNKSKK